MGGKKNKTESIPVLETPKKRDKIPTSEKLTKMLDKHKLIKNDELPEDTKTN